MPRVNELNVNGTSQPVDTSTEASLLGVLREQLDMTGCKIGCAEGICGACTVLIDNQPVRSCITPVGAAVGRAIRTIEGLEVDGRLHPLQQAFLDQGAMQCGYCTPGMIMSALGLLLQEPHPNEASIIEHMQGNICRCGAYRRIVKAIEQAASTLQADEVQGGGR